MENVGESDTIVGSSLSVMRTL
jgi:hypothetical protein